MHLFDNILNLPPPVLQHWGYFIILLITIFEGSPMFGVFLPGQTTVVTAGFLAKIGVFDFGDILFVSIIGAIAGDLVGYLLGKAYGYSFITKYGKYFFLKKEYFEKTQKIMNNHTAKTLILGRLNSLTRAFAPFIAGASNVSFKKFMIVNVIGGVCWASVFVSLGYIFGQSYKIASKYAGKFLFVAVLLIVAGIYIYEIFKKKSTNI